MFLDDNGDITHFTHTLQLVYFNLTFRSAIHLGRSWHTKLNKYTILCSVAWRSYQQKEIQFNSLRETQRRRTSPRKKDTGILAENIEPLCGEEDMLGPKRHLSHPIQPKHFQNMVHTVRKIATKTKRYTMSSSQIINLEKWDRNGEWLIGFLGINA